MGLDAHVFKSLTTLDAEFGRGRFDIDAKTGEPFARPPSKEIPLADLVAVCEHIGNAAEVAALRNLAHIALGNGTSLVLERVLYSGTHTGDLIELEHIPKLVAEVERLRRAGDTSLADVAAKMDRLAAAAEREQNPVVF